MARTRTLDPLEIRVIGVLMEKEQTTPDYYPMTLNALVAACNQKTNRDPVMQVDSDEVSDVLDRLRQDVLVWRWEGARSVRWQHSLDRRWNLDEASKAVMTLLLLRGPQTPGELRARSERMHSFSSVTEVEDVLNRLQEGFDALVKALPMAPGQREIRWMHLVGQTDAEDGSFSAGGPSYEDGPSYGDGPATAGSPSPGMADHDASPPGTGAARSPEPRSQAALSGALEERLEQLEDTVRNLEGTVETLAEELSSLRRRLGDV